MDDEEEEEELVADDGLVPILSSLCIHEQADKTAARVSTAATTGIAERLRIMEVSLGDSQPCPAGRNMARWA